MADIGILYSYTSVKTKAIAQKIVRLFDTNTIEELDANTIDKEKFLEKNTTIIGVPTWFDGELPNYLDEFLPELEGEDLSEKTFAIYGLGDQIEYPENFCDAMGIVADFLEKLGARIIGFTSTGGYTFEKSRAISDNLFIGLALDQENQGRLTDERIKLWVDQIKKEL